MPLPPKYLLPVFFLVLLIGAVVLGPLLYFGMAFVYPIPFHRAMDRALLISAVAALGLAWSRIPFRALWPLNHHAWKQVLLGLVIAAVSAQTMIGFNYAFNGFTSAHLPVAKLVSRVLLALVAALLVPPLEETVFRGFVQSELIECIGWRGGWLIAAVIYMCAHFLKIPTELDQQPVHLWSGVTALGAAFLPLTHGDFLVGNVGRALNLFLLGLIFGGIFLRCGSLWVNAGLHGGLIFILLLFTGLTRADDQPRVPVLGGDIVSSLSTTVVLVVLGLWLWRFYRHPSVVPETGENAP